MLDFKYKDKYNCFDLVEIMKLLRAPGGCPWDAEQNHQSIKKNLIEETYEVVEAINKNDTELLREELGDLEMQIVFHSVMEEETGSFDFDDVCDEVCKKLIIRHPHVFGDVRADTVDDVLTNWEEIKMKTKGRKSTSDSIRSIPRELPALMRAYKVQKKAADVGFDWDSVDGALDKIDEESAELRKAIADGNPADINDEFGDLLFSMVNVSRFLKIDPEDSLTSSTDKFFSRFAEVERICNERNIDMKTAGIQVLDAVWDEVKANNK